MSDYDKKIHSRKPDPYEKITINPIQKDKKGKEEFSKSGQEPTQSQIFATLISYFKKLITLFRVKGSEELLVFDQLRLFEDLIAIRSQLNILAQRDESHNPEFTKQLSELWHNLMDDCNSVPASLEISSRLIQEIKYFSSQISSYPPGVDHTLGYYFDAFAGKEWIPFPFMDMLKDLHEEYRDNSFDGHLAKWIFLLDDILDSFKT